jgi:hypothetical protein
MRKWIAGSVLALVVFALAWTAAAAPKTYQFTGVVKTVTGNAFTVQKSPTETWDFSTDGSTKGTPKVGDKVTVQYKMIATDIQTKPAGK